MCGSAYVTLVGNRTSISTKMFRPLIRLCNEHIALKSLIHAYVDLLIMPYYAIILTNARR